MKEQFLNLTGLTELVDYLKTSIANHKEILPYASDKLFPSVGDINTIYINTATNTIYRWDSSSKTYITLAKAVKSVAISEATENGKITLTVDGNKTTVPIHGLGSAAYTNSSAYSPAEHTHTKAQVGLGNVDNTADANKSVKHATTADSATTAGTATNISAGEGTADAARHVWFSDSTTETKRAYSDKFKYNPVTNNLTVNVTGNAATASNVAWGNVTGKPSTYTPSAHTHDDSTITSLDASKLFGMIDIERLPQGSLERCIIVEDDAARFALTADNIQLGDTVKVKNTEKMYFVIDESKLDSEEGYTVYAAGTAASVPWSGITGKPASYPPSEHMHNEYLSDLTISGKTITYTKGDGTTGEIVTQDTWRGIQDNLNSESPVDSLSAAQGKILNEKKLGAVNANGYFGITKPDGTSNDWIRTTSLGIIPYQSGESGNGHSSLGNESWYFSSAYIDNIYGNLRGNASSANKLVTARKIGSASFDGSADITLTQMGIVNPIELTRAEYNNLIKNDLIDDNQYYNVIDDYDSDLLINDTITSDKFVYSSDMTEKTYSKKSISYNATLNASNWSGSSSPYSYTLSLTGVTNTNIVEINYAPSASDTAIEAYQEAGLKDGGQVTDQITLLATEKPTVNIPITVVIRNDL